eukprot:Hpha_TRINITY_DN14932_c0_g5::TRINITY_DN14932_c0_g5_i1::g.143040::m.143040
MEDKREMGEGSKLENCLEDLHFQLRRVRDGEISAGDFESMLRMSDEKRFMQHFDFEGHRHTLLTHAIRCRSEPCIGSLDLEEVVKVLIEVTPEGARVPCKDLKVGTALSPLQYAKRVQVSSIREKSVTEVLGPLTVDPAQRELDELAAMYIKRMNEILRRRKHAYDEPAADLGEGLFLGDREHAQDFYTLKRRGVSHVLNMAPGMCGLMCGRDGITVKAIDAEDMEGYDLLGKHFDEARKYIDQSREGGKAVLVHCYAGINRSATISVAYLMAARGMKLLEAVRHAFERRSCILSNTSFREQLVLFAIKNGHLDD